MPAYKKAIQLCDSDNVLKSSLLTAIAMVHYATGRKNDCKTCLFTAYANVAHYLFIYCVNLQFPDSSSFD